MNGQIKANRKMRAYLVKEEFVLEKLAQQKFDEDLRWKQNVQATSRGAISSIEAHSNSFGSIMSKGGHSTFQS